MPSVDVPNVGTIDFPDSMSEEEIRSTIKRKFYIEPALKGLNLTHEAIDQVFKIVTNPLAGEASSMARHQSLAKQLPQVAQEGKSPSQILAEARIGSAQAAGEAAGPVTTLITKLPYAAAADVTSKLAGQSEYGGNVAALGQERELPAEAFIRSAAGAAPNLALAARLGEGASEMAPMMGMGFLGGTANRLIAAGFTVQMVARAPELFKAYAEEANKPQQEQDPGKLNELKAGIIETFLFGPLAGAGAVGGIPVSDVNPRIKLSNMLDAVKAPQVGGGMTQPSRPSLPYTSGLLALGIKPDRWLLMTRDQQVRNLARIGEEPPPEPPAAPPITEKPVATVLPHAATQEDKLKEGIASIEQAQAKTRAEVTANEAQIAAREATGVLPQTIGKVAEVAPLTANELAKTAQAGKGADALHQQAAEVLQPVREQPEQGAREVSTQGAGAEAGARSEPVIPQKTQDVIDFERYQQLLQEVKGKNLDEALPQAKEMEEIKSRYGGLAPPEPEVITHAAYTDEQGNVHVGANHPEILDKLGVEGFKTRTSRNTPQFGFRTNRRPFITREEAGPVATKAGQNLEKFDPGEQVHSDQVRSPIERDKALGDAPAQPALGPQEGMGAAKIGELADIGIGGDIYGIAQRVREDRAKAGQVDPVEPGKGVTVQDSIDYGRRINAADPGAPERFLKQFESDPDKNFSKAMIASTRAHGEYLAQLQRIAESQFGTDSPEYNAARNALSEWDRRTKPIQTEWGASGQAQQAWTDLDTGSVGGLERERIRLTEKEFTPEEKVEAGKLSKDVREATTDTDKAAKAVNQELESNASPERKQAVDEKAEADAVKGANDAADKVAEAEAKEREAKDKAQRKVAQIQLDAARKAEIAARKTVERARKQADQSRRVVQQRAQLNDQAEAARKAMDAVYKTLREAAVARAEAENKARVAQTVRDRQTADIQRKAAMKAEQAALKLHRQAAAREAALERKLVGDAAIPVWDKARQYLKAYDSDGREVPSGIRFDDLRNKIAADLGMPVDKVTRLLARSKRMKYLTDDLWLKQARERNAKTKAKLWVQGLDMPAYEKFIRAIPRVTFAIRVGFHGTVALGTHAPAVAFDPRFWGSYVRNFGKMYGMVAKRTFYEGQMQDLLRRKNYATARRAGLVNDPYKYEGFERQGVTSEMAGHISEAMSKSLGLPLEYFTKMGERGYSILKVLRQDMFDQHWDSLPRQMQTTEMAQAIADSVNHITGVVSTPSPLGAELALFAPKLQMSRAAFLFGDPIRAARTGVRAGVRAIGQRLGVSRSKLPFVTPAEKYFAINEVKSKTITLATLGSLLALNQGILMATGSKQQVNLTDPFKNDFAKFKVAGLNVSYGNPLLTMPRLALRIGTVAAGPGGKLRKMVYPDESAAKMAWEYFRSQLSPFASLAADNVFREDWQGRQLPQSERPEPKRLLAQGIEPYTPGEYWTQQLLPIPFQEFVRETWKSGYGMSPEQVKTELKALGATAFMGATGGRISADTAVEHAQ